MKPYVPSSEDLDKELSKLPLLGRDDLKERYFGRDAGPMLEFISRSAENAAAVNWMSQMLELWRDIRRSLAFAMAYDRWYGGLPEGMVPDEIVEMRWDNSEFEERVAKWEMAEAGCVCYLENALFRFYAFNSF